MCACGLVSPVSQQRKRAWSHITLHSEERLANAFYSVVESLRAASYYSVGQGCWANKINKATGIPRSSQGCVRGRGENRKRDCNQVNN